MKARAADAKAESGDYYAGKITRDLSPENNAQLEEDMKQLLPTIRRNYRLLINLHHYLSLTGGTDRFISTLFLPSGSAA